MAVPPRMSIKKRLESVLTGADLVAAGIGLRALIAGLVLIVLASSHTASIVGVGLVGVAGVAFVSLAFLLVGESEDRSYRDGGLPGKRR